MSPFVARSAEAGLAFACVWDEDREATWSHIPANLFEALSRHVRVADVEAEPSEFIRRVRVGLNRRGCQPLWVPHPWNFVLRRREIKRLLRACGAPVALQINDLAVLDTPYWVYRDMTWKQVAEYGGDSATGLIDPRLVRLHRRHEARVYRNASGVFAFSEWAARSVQQITRVRTVVVPPGVNAPVPQATTRHKVPRLLFVGRAFERKGGPEVVAAVTELRRRLDVSLDVVGPSPPPKSQWPQGVFFHGSLSPEDTSRLFGQASLFVMPSQFEAYGIALIEALACGVPCVARDVCAMPEILDDGKWGHLVSSEDPDELARVLESALIDSALHERVLASQQQFRRFYSWDRAAIQMLSELRRDAGDADGAAQLEKIVPPAPS